MTRAVRLRILLVVMALLLLLTACSRRKETAPAAETVTAQTTVAVSLNSARSESAETETESSGAQASGTNTPAAAVNQATSDLEPAPEATPTPIDEENTIITSTGLQYTESEAGTGPKPQTGDVVAVHYTGTLSDGTVFDSSYNRGEPIRFPLGVGSVIAGWDEGIALMSEGGKAVLVIPPELAYGESGAGGGVIPPNATLIFDVELVEVSEGAPDAPTAVDAEDYVKEESGLKYYDIVVGEGTSPRPGQQIVVHYTGWLKESGERFDSSHYTGQPLTFNVGMGQVIPGWDLGLRTMNMGGIRQLVIPPELAYGDTGAGGGVIPPNATLIFEVELVDVR